MFIKVVKSFHESMYECERFHVRPLGDTKFMIDLDPGSICVEIDKAVPEALGVYVMNNEGRTIDSLFQKNADD